MGGFRLDTSGAVEMRRDLLANGVPAEPDRVTWPDLSPFEQGYVEALFASLRFFHMECPACDWDCIVGPPGIRDLGLMCPLCAGDNGLGVYLRTIGGERDMPAKVEGYDARSSLRFDRIHPETLAAIRKDCATIRQTGFYGDTDEDGANFFRERQRNENPSYPPLTITLSDDGKVRTSPVDGTTDPLSRSGKTQTPTPSLGTQEEQDR